MNLLMARTLVTAQYRIYYIPITPLRLDPYAYIACYFDADYPDGFPN